MMMNYKKRLEGIDIANNDELLELWIDAYYETKKTKKENADGDENENEEPVLIVEGENENDTAKEQKKDNRKLLGVGSDGGGNPWRPRESAPKTTNDANILLRKYGDPRHNKKEKEEELGNSSSPVVVILPIRILQALQIFYDQDHITNGKKIRFHCCVERQMKNGLVSTNTTTSSSSSTPSPSSVLVFTSPPVAPSIEDLSPERQHYLHRIEKLKLLTEERKYKRLTGNIHDGSRDEAGEHNASSMTYAMSVGMNMIIAPISFGAFMYFFSGGVFDYLFPKGDEYERKHPNAVDIKRVIVGVVSGVVMMIIEMVLFVIRSHEIDYHMTKKKKKRGVQPFGAYSSSMPKSYTDEDCTTTTIGTTGKATTTTTKTKKEQ